MAALRPRQLRAATALAAVLSAALTWGAMDLWGPQKAVGLAYPPLPADARYVRIAPLVQTALTGPHAFMHLDRRGQPVRYDPCRPVHYVINPAGGPPGAVDLVNDAVHSISTATGLAFVYDGTTTEVVSDERPSVQRARYGDRWAPVLIGFAARDAFPGLTGAVAGLGGSTELSTDAGDRLVTGQITLASDTFARLTAAGRLGQATTIVMHELGHVVGLAHVADPQQLMYTSNRGQVTYGPGDVQALAIAGDGPCFRDT